MPPIRTHDVVLNEMDDDGERCHALIEKFGLH